MWAKTIICFVVNFCILAKNNRMGIFCCMFLFKKKKSSLFNQNFEFCLQFCHMKQRFLILGKLVVIYLLFLNLGTHLKKFNVMVKIWKKTFGLNIAKSILCTPLLIKGFPTTPITCAMHYQVHLSLSMIIN